MIRASLAVAFAFFSLVQSRLPISLHTVRTSSTVIYSGSFTLLSSFPIPHGFVLREHGVYEGYLLGHLAQGYVAGVCHPLTVGRIGLLVVADGAGAYILA